MSSTELTATFLYERHVFLNDGGAVRVIIADAQLANDEMVTLRGEAHEGQLSQGLDYRFYGSWVDHHKHGRQFVFKSFVMEEPAGQRAVVTYLQQCKGIGYVVAKRLWDSHGDDAVRWLRTAPKEVAQNTKGLSAKIAEQASEFLSQNEATERAKMDLLAVLHKRGFPKKTVELALRDFGSAAAKEIKRNPYLLMRYPGCGFISCDKMWIDLGLSPSRLKRQALCGWNALARDSRGDTWFASRKFIDGIEKEVSGVDLSVDKAIELSLRGGLIGHREWRGTSLFALRARARQEGTVARIIGGIIGEGRSGMWPVIDGMDVSEHQGSEIAKALSGRLGILGGSPGTGKSYSTAEIVKGLMANSYRMDDIAVAAPTGKAAVRVTEAMHSAGVPFTARTIHSLLGVQSVDGGGWSFTHGADNPLPFAFIFIDEVSMLDCTLAASFLSAVSPDTHVLLVGDVNQLPPVGHGAPLRDMIAAGVPYGELTEIRRNSGRIVRSCAEIRDHRRFSSSESLDLEAGENLLHVEKPDSESQIEILDHMLVQFRDGQEFNEIWDVQVLVPLNKRGDLSRKSLNNRMQSILNPGGERVAGNPFRVRDKIINTKNGWFPAVDPDDESANEDGKLYVANGEQAEVCSVEPNRTVAKLTSPDRMIVIPKGQQSDDESSEGEESESAGTGCQWELGYAISVHKSQGSEWPVCLVVIDSSSGARMVQSRQWFYTAISRAKTFCVTIGQSSVIRDMMSRDGMRRQTLLVERINKELAAIRSRRVAEQVKRWDWSEISDGVLSGGAA